MTRWLHADAIARLAGAELECDCDHGIDYSLSGMGGEGCEERHGTGAIVPFEALRVACPDGGHWHGPTLNPVWCTSKWIPQSNVKVACWEVWMVVQEEFDLSHNRFLNDKWVALTKSGAIEGYEGDTPEEAVLRAAVAWVAFIMKTAWVAEQQEAP